MRCASSPPSLPQVSCRDKHKTFFPKVTHLQKSICFHLKVLRPLQLLMFITVACKLVWNIGKNDVDNKRKY
jgi:hypothetical protein